MLRRQYALPAIVLALSILATTEAVAAGQRSFVASNGLDTNPCTLQLPCRTFAPAIAATNADGEVIVLDSAGYGSFTITKSISIIAPPGVYAGFSPTAGQDGVTISAGASDKVVLRGLTINGQGGTNGIAVNFGGELHIEQCTVSNMVGDGIRINPGASGGQIHIQSSVFHSNAGHGLYLYVPSGTATVDVADSQFIGNGDGGVTIQSGGKFTATRIVSTNNVKGVWAATGFASDNVFVSVSDSVLSENAQSGMRADAGAAGSTLRGEVVRTTASRNVDQGFLVNAAAGTVVLSVSDSVAGANNNGLSAAGAGGTVIVTRSTLANNVSFDITQSTSAVVRTSGNNTLTGRGAPDISGTLTANPLQ